ncbi:MAG: hypothetical protein J5940_03650 [Clostridia bacterium]|nr:hypothetical protein [Clostridia bacterium]
MERENKKKLKVSAALAAAVTVIAVAFSLFAVYGAGGTSTYLSPSIFINDEPYRYDDNTPLLIIENEYYVPAAIFSSLGVSSEERDDIDSFVLYRRESGGESYISFITASPEAMTPSGRIAVPPPYTIGATHYIPLEITCRCLSVAYDVSTNYPELSDYSVAIRIYDAGAKLSMPRLLESYKKATATASPSTQTSGEASSSSSSGDTPVPVERGNIFLCIAPSEGDFDSLLTVLYEYEVNAAVFLDRDFITSHPEKVTDVVASGNTLGILIDYEVRSEEELKAELSEINDLLMYEVKAPARLVMYRFENDDLRIAASADSTALRHGGYYLVLPDVCFDDSFVDIPARELRRVGEAVSTKIEVSGGNSLSFLRDILDYFTEYSAGSIQIVLPTEVSL